MPDTAKIKLADKTFIIAHRGFADGCLENTMQAFEKAISIGADMVEFDVRRTLDGRFIVIHDDRLENMEVSSLKFEEIRKIGLSKGYVISELSEVIQTIGNRILLDIEIKEIGYEKEIISIICNRLKTDRFIVSSFNDITLKAVKNIDGNIITGLILGLEKPKNLIATRLSEIFPNARLKKTGADLLIPHWKIMKIWCLTVFIRPKKNIFVWTVNDEKIIRRLMKKRVAGIITDSSDLALIIKKNR